LSSASHTSVDISRTGLHSVVAPTQRVRPSAQTPNAVVSHTSPAPGQMTVPLRIWKRQVPGRTTLDMSHMIRLIVLVREPGIST
jgi:hypothetical protein